MIGDKLIPSARRFRTMKCVKNKFKYIFSPSATQTGELILYVHCVSVCVRVCVCVHEPKDKGCTTELELIKTLFYKDCSLGSFKNLPNN